MQPREHRAQHQAAPAYEVEPTSNGGWLQKALLGLLALLTLMAIAYFGTKAVGALAADSSVKSKQYQAVFLTNGQVYFGQLSKATGDYIQLKKIYYLQVSNGTQTTVQPRTGTDDAQQQVSLAKLGGELHGPEDTMYINRDQVLFWENLKSDGKVTKAISDYQAQNK